MGRTIGSKFDVGLYFHEQWFKFLLRMECLIWNITWNFSSYKMAQHKNICKLFWKSFNIGSISLFHCTDILDKTGLLCLMLLRWAIMWHIGLLLYVLWERTLTLRKCEIGSILNSMCAESDTFSSVLLRITMTVV